ncbi:DUF6273 domain-containing protein [Staphylospora marina]|uniref:DUF6273 domain-containing protein n=1 Tax=Staphylospora marina TaxID=2490858 RepID=UPI000F5B8957|nr:DUF6273 domain-containing protein [Staphylospora marina]
MDTDRLKRAKPGEVITFGTYPHTADGTDHTPIRWRVIEKSDREGIVILLSERLLDCRRYHGESAEIKWRDCVDMTWQDCDLRKWLNQAFFHRAFRDAEKELILPTRCTDNGEDTPDTVDKVFLPSIPEIEKWSEIHGKELRRAVGTEYAKVKKPDGCDLYVYDKSNPFNYLNIDGEKHGCSWWWLRTRGNKPSRACFVGTGGRIRTYANNSVSRYGIRPVIRIRIP